MPADPISCLIETILSQNTTDRNRDRAYSSLMTEFPTWMDLFKASAEDISSTISVAGLQNQKTRAIQCALRRILEHEGEFDLGFLRTFSCEEAINWLTECPGVGKKTAGIVVLFSFQKPYFPVDTHIHRVLKRVGIIGKAADPHEEVNGIVPKDASLMASLHLNLIAHGRAICTPRNPSCNECVIKALCRRAF